jgi:hypothetical protein
MRGSRQELGDPEQPEDPRIPCSLAFKKRRKVIQSKTVKLNLYLLGENGLKI